MTYLNPAMLWGILALTIPVAIHFWYQKKGKVIDWAAFQWLADQTSLTHRGFRLDEIPLLLLRLVLLLLFILLLAKPVTNWFNSKKVTQKIHLVEPNSQLVNNFRFELEQAIKNNEKIYWISGKPEPVNGLSNLPEIENPELFLQQDISRLNRDNTQLNLYISNAAKWGDLPKVIVNESFKLFSAVDSSSNHHVQYLDLGSDKRLFVDKGILQVASQGEKPVKFVQEAAHEGTIKVLINYGDEAEQETVQAALSALTEVYEIPFEIDLTANKATKYEWIFSDKVPRDPNPKILYMARNADFNTHENVIPVPDSLQIRTSDLVRNGRLPEWLGEILINHYHLEEHNTPLSTRQLAALFEKVTPDLKQSADKVYSWILLAFVITLLLERWISLKKTVTQAYV